MTKRYSKQTTKKTTVKLSPKEAEDIIEKEFGDTEGNKTKIRFDFNPHPIDEGTINIYYDYGDNNDNTNSRN